MLVRIWKTVFDVSQQDKLEKYANEVSLPVLSTRAGNRGVLFYTSNDQWTTFTIWDGQASIDALDSDEEYARIVKGILDLGVLGEKQETQIFEYAGGKVQV